MIVPRYRIGPSLIPLAGQGAFLLEPVARGRVLVAPTDVKLANLRPRDFLDSLPREHPDVASSIRWFEQTHTICPEWDDECYLNHSFEPCGLWHLGFVFARRDLEVGTELTLDYQLIIGDHEPMPFRDSVTGREIIGLPWKRKMLSSTRELLALVEQLPD